MKDTKGLLFLDWLEVDWLHSCALTHAGVGLRAAEARSEKERKGFEEFVFFFNLHLGTKVLWPSWLSVKVVVAEVHAEAEMFFPHPCS